MALDIKKAEYYNITVDGQLAEGSKMLSVFADAGVNLLAFKAVALEPSCTRFTLFPNDSSKMKDGARKAGIKLDGPYPSIIIKGDTDNSGDLAGIYNKLSQANINVKESSGIADMNGCYGVVLYLESEDCEKALAILEK